MLYHNAACCSMVQYFLIFREQHSCALIGKEPSFSGALLFFCRGALLHKSKRAPQSGHSAKWPVLWCNAACCSMLQHVAACCSMLQYVVACCSMLQHVAVAACCSILQHVAACCSMLQNLLDLQKESCFFLWVLGSFPRKIQRCCSLKIKSKAHCSQLQHCADFWFL